MLFPSTFYSTFVYMRDIFKLILYVATYILYVAENIYYLYGFPGGLFIAIYFSMSYLYSSGLGYRNDLESGGYKAMVSDIQGRCGRGSKVATGVLVQP